MIFTFRELTSTLALKKSKGKGAHDPKVQTAGAYPGFLSMNMPRRIATLTSTAVRAFRTNFQALLRELLVVIQKENLLSP